MSGASHLLDRILLGLAAPAGPCQVQGVVASNWAVRRDGEVGYFLSAPSDHLESRWRRLSSELIVLLRPGTTV